MIMIKVVNKSTFILRARIVHGWKYDYSLVVYKNTKTPVEIICPDGHHFWQSPATHLKGSGCRYCYDKVRKKLIYGVGVNDLENTKGTRLYKEWCGILVRCFSPSYRKQFKSYEGVTVCEEWLTLSNFKKWFDENYIEGYSLDKDILKSNNRIYSPETCCFVPQKINMLVVPHGKGKHGTTKSEKGFIARISKNREVIKIGEFATLYEANQAYKQEKESYVKEVATDYYNRGEISERVYNALMNWKIEIKD